LFTDFGMTGPYIGQMKSVLVQQSPTSPIIDLFSDLPACDPRAAAYLLAAYISDFPADTVFLCVVDPGVGSARRPVVARVDGQWFVGPDNGLFDIVARHGHDVTWWEIVWRPDRLASTFHGRDLFAPIAARLASGSLADGDLYTIQKDYHSEWPDDYAHVIYIDHFGNAITGIRASTLDKRTRISVNNNSLAYANTFSDVAVQEAFWYENANGLVEIAVNQCRADEMMGIKVGDPVQWQE
jgi:S-adenosylmethionine hydrolase